MTKFRVVLLFCLSLVVPIAVFGDTLTSVLNNIATQLPTNTTGSITAATLRGVLDNMATYSATQRSVNPIEFGALCNGSTDDHVALQAAASAAITQSRPLYIPGQYCMNSASITLNGNISIHGDSEVTSVIAMTADVPAFVWTVSDTYEQFDWRDFSIFAPASSTKAGILVQGGTGSNFIQRGQFRNIQLLGFLYGIEFNNTTSSNWNLFDGVDCNDGGIQTQYCFYFPVGSGTGNVFTNLRPKLNRASAAVLRYEGSGKNVGDIIVTEGHFCCNGSIISIGAGTVYRSRIALDTSQYDAGVVKAFDFDTTGVPYTNVRLMANNSGGNTVTGVSANTSASIIDDMNVNVRRAGTANGTSGVGTFSTPIFTLTFPTGIGAPTFGFVSTVCDVTITGLIGNVGAGAVSEKLLVFYNNTNPTVTAGTPLAGPAGVWTISTSATSTALTINADITEASGSSFDAQISCTGGIFTLTKIP